jgi:hypothetical protein
MSQKNSNEEEYISLTEATKYCDYSQEYLSLRARQGKLKAEKLGRNWVTTKEWVEEYFGKTNSSQARAQEKKANGSSFSDDKYSSAVTGALGEVGKTIEKSKIIFDKPELRYAVASILVFIFLGAGFMYAGPTLSVAKDLFVENLAVFSEKTNKGVSNFSIDAGCVFDSARNNDITNMKYGVGYTGRMVSEYTQWLDQTIMQQPIYAVKENVALGAANISNSSKSFYNKYLVANNWVEEKIIGYYNAIACFWRKDVTEAEKQVVKKDIGFVGEEVDILEENIMSDIGKRFEEFRDSAEFEKEKQGAIIAPLKPGQKAEDEIAKLKNSFSDEVEIQPEDENSGVITPVFRERKGDEYLYLIVPIKEEE